MLALHKKLPASSAEREKIEREIAVTDEKIVLRCASRSFFFASGSPSKHLLDFAFRGKYPIAKIAE